MKTNCTTFVSVLVQGFKSQFTISINKFIYSLQKNVLCFKHMVMTIGYFLSGQGKHFHFDMLNSDREKSDSSVTAFYIYSLYYPCAVLQCCRLQAAHSSDVCGLVSICSIVRVSSVCQHPAALQSAVRVTGTHCTAALQHSTHPHQHFDTFLLGSDTGRGTTQPAASRRGGLMAARPQSAAADHNDSACC